jgi:PDZ domain
VEPGRPLPRVVLQLRSRPGITGHLLLSKGDDFRFGVIHCLRVDPGRPPDLKRLVSEGMTNFSLRPEKGHLFTITGILPGTYLIGASRGNGPVLVADTVEVADQMVTRDLAMPPLARSDYLVLRVVGPDGRLLSDVDVSTGFRSKSGGSSVSGGGELRQPDGTFWVAHHGWQGLEDEEGTNSVTVRAEGYPAKTVEYRRSETSELTVELGEPAILDVTVEGYDPRTLEGTIGVAIEEEKAAEEEGGDDSPRFRAARMARRRFSRMNLDEAEEIANGKRTIGPLEPGNYRVLLQYQGGRRGGFPVAATPVTIRAGKNSVSIRMPALYSLRVRVDGGPRRMNLSLGPAQEGGDLPISSGQEVGSDGQAVFDGLPAGTYKITLHTDGEPGEMLVSVPGQREVRFQARKLDAMLLKLRDAEGRLAKAGFQDGDLIVGVNGAGFESRNEWWNLLRQGFKEKEVKVQVQRGGALLELSVDPRRIRDSEEAALEPASR